MTRVRIAHSLPPLLPAHSSINPPSSLYSPAPLPLYRSASFRIPSSASLAGIWAALCTSCLPAALLLHLGWFWCCVDPKGDPGAEFCALCLAPTPFRTVVVSVARILSRCSVMCLLCDEYVCEPVHICDLISDIIYDFRHIVYTLLYGRGGLGVEPRETSEIFVHRFRPLRVMPHAPRRTATRGTRAEPTHRRYIEGFKRV